MTAYSYTPTIVGGMLPAPWFTHHTWAIDTQDNAYGIFIHAGHAWADLVYEAELDGLDHYAECRLNLGGGTYVDGWGPAVRFTPNSDGSWTGYALLCTHYDSGGGGQLRWEIRRNNAIVVGPTVYAPLNGANSGAPFTARIEVEGSEVRAFLDGTQVGTYTDPTPITNSRYAGISVHDVAGGAYSWAAGDLTTAPPETQDESGGSAAAVTATATGAGTGRLTASGGSSTSISIDSAGAGSSAEITTDGSSTTVTVTTAGTGTAQERAPPDGSSATITVSAAGNGTGTVTASGGSAATIEVAAAGSGRTDENEVYSGGAAASISTTSSGAGTGHLEVAQGSSSGIEVTAAGAGTDTPQEVHNGGSGAAVAATADGAGTGRIEALYGAPSTVSVAATGAGSGTVAAAGGAPTAVAIRAAGAGFMPETREFTGGTTSIDAGPTGSSTIDEPMGGTTAWRN